MHFLHYYLKTLFYALLAVLKKVCCTFRLLPARDEEIRPLKRKRRSLAHHYSPHLSNTKAHRYSPAAVRFISRHFFIPSPAMAITATKKLHASCA
jgi:hypothetical protein